MSPPYMDFMLLHIVSFSPIYKGIYRISCCGLLHVNANHRINYGGRKGRFRVRRRMQCQKRCATP